MEKNKITKEQQFLVSKANEEDSSGIHKILIKNLIEVKDVKSLTPKEKKLLKEHGFLRKEVPESYYLGLIKDSEVDIYIAKNLKNEIIGFASFHLNKADIRKFRSSVEKIDATSPENLDILTNSENKFIYLDQIAVDPKYHRSGIGKLIFQKALQNFTKPIVSFIVKIPLDNLASAKWHERVGFTQIAQVEGNYKETKFNWCVYLFEKE
ncbi:GNAT family N-acetyltransferase [Promethearchaeum syntrophicum]|uniref:GNAT family N-acetyltransferase n=1 Tax=Promethearchaeum syntrophicum TaxID=2594042 RepID=A0A5B9DDM3_9ARCH|nr:GNAT family N-acetyltransferase [Candidatus Prometheoarchaeum syntrophicum]QEE16863.1 Acetyltransferase (GNAT) family protein [Candidatus Prometheoarchaeum syntrophicum]